VTKLSPALPDAEKVEKYTTHVEPSLVKKIQIEAIEKEINDYDAMNEACSLMWRGIGLI
jgi:hypothetical protein